MTQIELIVGDADEFSELSENVVLCALDDNRRLYAAGEHVFLCRVRKNLRTAKGDLPGFVDFHELDASVLRSTMPPMLALRSELATPALGRLTYLVAVVPPLRRPAEACPLIATARLAAGGATLIADPATAAMITHLINPERRIAA